MIPDVYRGPYKFDEVDAGEKYARDVKEKIQSEEITCHHMLHVACCIAWTYGA